MTIRMTARQGKRWGMSALAAMVCCLGAPAASFAGDGPSVFGRKPSGPIFKTLDAFAGGIELVLEKTVLSHAKSKHGCDSLSCDDGCDAITLHQLDMYRDGQFAVPEAYHPAPAFEPLMPPLSEIAPPRSAPLTMPRVPADVPTTPVQKQTPQPNLSTDDGWIDSFAPSTPNRVRPPRRQVPEANDSLLDPFQDDPQTRGVPQRSPSTRLQLRKSVKAAGFVQPN